MDRWMFHLLLSTVVISALFFVRTYRPVFRTCRNEQWIIAVNNIKMLLCDIDVLDSASLGADRGGESTGEFICIAALVIVDSVVVVAVSPTSEPSCVSWLSTKGEEAECAAEAEGRAPGADRRPPESPTDPTPKLCPDLVVICCLLCCLAVSFTSSLMLKGLHGT